jgi:hypothetical protein
MRITRGQLKRIIQECMSGDMAMGEWDATMAATGMEMVGHGGDQVHTDGRALGSGGSASMARGQLFTMAQNAQSLYDRLTDDDELPEWVQYKITMASDYISTAEEYLSYKMHRYDSGDPLPAYESRSRYLNRLAEDAVASAGKEVNAGSTVSKAQQLIQKMPALEPVFKQIDTSKEIAGLIQAIVEYSIAGGGVEQKEVIAALNTALSAARSVKPK